MSQKRRPRDVQAEECPKCGSKPGDPCKSYKGRGCAPHSIPDDSQPAGLVPVVMHFKPVPVCEGVQLLLFEDLASAVSDRR